jgi:uncharacterized membrane protein
MIRRRLVGFAVAAVCFAIVSIGAWPTVALLFLAALAIIATVWWLVMERRLDEEARA